MGNAQHLYNIRYCARGDMQNRIIEESRNGVSSMSNSVLKIFSSGAARNQ